MYIPPAADMYTQQTFDSYWVLIHYLEGLIFTSYTWTTIIMNLQQAWNMLELDTAIFSQFQHSAKIHTGQTNSSPQTHGGRVDFSFLLKLIPTIFSNVDTRSLLNVTAVEPGAGEARFAITFWVIFSKSFSANTQDHKHRKRSQSSCCFWTMAVPFHVQIQRRYWHQPTSFPPSYFLRWLRPPCELGHHMIVHSQGHCSH